MAALSFGCLLVVLAGCGSTTHTGAKAHGGGATTSSVAPTTTTPVKKTIKRVTRTTAPATTTTTPATTTTTPPTTSAPTTTPAVPALGLAGAYFEGTGFGQSRPSTIDLGGDPTGVVTGITWSSWGYSEAVGTGIAEYLAPNQITADGTEEQATVVAYGLGTCDAHYVYQYVRWYFPEHGQTLSDNPDTVVNACVGPAN